MIRRYYATKDNTITNAFEENLTTRGTGSNMGASDILETFSIYNQISNSSGISSELARILIEFDIDDISTDRTQNLVPGSGSVSWYLKMYDAPHSQTVPSNFTLEVQGINGSWQEGYGLDMDFYEDLTKNGIGSNWINAQKLTAATATITAVAPGGLSGGATFTLTNAAGVTTTYRINGGGAYATQPGGTAGTTIDVFFFGASTVAHVAEAIKKAINATTDADMTATDNGTDITITQSTTGITGNKTNANNSTGLSSVGNFEGAVGEWTTAGGDYHASPLYTQAFSSGLEDLCLDVSGLVEEWIKGAGGGGKDNNGFGIKLTSTLENEKKSFFTKKFFGRDSEFYFQRPVLEARWDSSRRDDRGSFYLSSSLAGAEDNLNTIYLYNSIRGKLKNIPDIGEGAIGVSIFSSSANTPTGAALVMTEDTVHVLDTNNLVITGGHVSTGIYSATLAFTGSTTLTSINDVWFKLSDSVSDASSVGAIQYATGTVNLKSFTAGAHNPETAYVLSMPRLKKEYRTKQTHRLDLYVREKNWSPNIHTLAVRSSIPSLIIPSASFQLRRCIDDYVVVPYGTGSTTEPAYTALSFDVSGNYFDLDATYLETGYLYEIQYSFYDEENGWEEQPYRFKFRVVD